MLRTIDQLGLRLGKKGKFSFNCVAMGGLLGVPTGTGKPGKMRTFSSQGKVREF